MKNYHALLLPLSAGFVQLDDRLLYDNGVALVFESREDAQRYVAGGYAREVVDNKHVGQHRLGTVELVIEPVTLGLCADPSATSAVARLDGLEVSIIRDSQGKSIVEIEGPDDNARLLPNGSPDIRIWLNEALIYRDGETGPDLNHPIFTGRQF